MKPMIPSRTFPRRVSHFKRRLLPAAIIAAGQALCAAPAWSGPDGGRVVVGDGVIDQVDRTTTITQNTDRMVINWDSFNVNADEVVNYIQSGVDSIALNQILGGNGSQILGQINANGQVVLVNPHGVVFGEGARINVGGIIASGLSIDTSDFMNGDFTFSALEGADGHVINRGIIEAASGGSVSLIGKQIKNEGLISANLGAVNLAAGKEAVVTFDDVGLMGVRVTKEILQNELGVDAALINEGQIDAAGGRILLTASNQNEAVRNSERTFVGANILLEANTLTEGDGDALSVAELAAANAVMAGVQRTAFSPRKARTA